MFELIHLLLSHQFLLGVGVGMAVTYALSITVLVVLVGWDEL